MGLKNGHNIGAVYLKSVKVLNKHSLDKGEEDRGYGETGPMDSSFTHSAASGHLCWQSPFLQPPLSAVMFLRDLYYAPLLFLLISNICEGVSFSTL